MSDGDRGRVWAPPRADAALEQDDENLAVGHRRVVRVHLVAWVALLLLCGAAALGLGAELWTPEMTTSPVEVQRVFEIHSAAGFAALLLPVAGLGGLMSLPARLGRAGFRWQWLAWVGFVAWALGTLGLLAATEPIAWTGPSTFFAIAAVVSGLACLAVMIVIELLTSTSKWREAPLLVFGIGVGSVLQLLAFAQSVLQALGPRFGIGTFGSGLGYLEPLAYPIALGIAGDVLERVGTRTLPRRSGMIAIAAIALAPWLEWVPVLPVVGLVAAIVVVIAGPILWLRGANRADPRAVAALLTIVLVGCGSLASNFLGSLSVDVHLHDTYFVIGALHFAFAAGFFVIVLCVLDRPDLALDRTPHRGLTLAGLVALAGGFGLSFGSQLVLGQRGMPRRYATYIDLFESLFQCSFIGAAIAALGLVILATAFLRGQASASGKSRA